MTTKEREILISLVLSVIGLLDAQGTLPDRYTRGKGLDKLLRELEDEDNSYYGDDR